MASPRQQRGAAGEAAACQHLAACGLTVVARNWRCRLGELDVVALEGGQVVFVEVKTRTSDRFGTGAEAVDPRKQARLVRLAHAFLQARGWEGLPVRFDVVVVTPAGGGQWAVEWIRDAFGA